jgi:small multidrug resistance family-3 protein
MTSLVALITAAFFEIAGCFAFWDWLRGGRPVCVVLPGTVRLVLFALFLTRVDATSTAFLPI